MGEEAWQSFGNRGPLATLTVISEPEPVGHHLFAGLDAFPQPDISLKIGILKEGAIVWLNQNDQYLNPDHKMLLGDPVKGGLLSDYAQSVEGLSTGDNDRFVRRFWELDRISRVWERLQGPPSITSQEGGCEDVLLWEEGIGQLHNFEGARVQGQAAWGKQGVLVGQLRVIRGSRYQGDKHNKITAAIIPHDPRHLPALWAFCSSPCYHEAVRHQNKKLTVSTGTLVQVPFDLARWQAEAAQMYPLGLPEPHCNDPTQWLFKGDVTSADAPQNLQVAMARLLGYRWPDQPADALDRLAVPEGIACLPALGGEDGGAKRLADLLATAYGSTWSPARQQDLLAAVDFAGKPLEDWLRDGFFEQHCKLFHNRPFLWHVWDGRKDGFSAIVNYHQLDRLKLEKLTHHYLALCIKRQRDGVNNGESGADGRLAAAEQLHQKLKRILEGESPYDIFVRWKPLSQQPLGWEPPVPDGRRAAEEAEHQVVEGQGPRPGVGPVVRRLQGRPHQRPSPDARREASRSPGRR